MFEDQKKDTFNKKYFPSFYIKPLFGILQQKIKFKIVLVM